MCEWSKQTVLKTVRSQGLVGSNPTAPALRLVRYTKPHEALTSWGFVLIFTCSLSTPLGGENVLSSSFHKLCGGIHGVYTFLSIAALILLYAFTPVSATSDAYRAVVSILLMGHIVAGVIQPDWHTNGTVSRNTWLTAIGAWIILLGAWLRPYVF